MSHSFCIAFCDPTKTKSKPEGDFKVKWFPEQGINDKSNNKQVKK
jgi:hypothetical protein